MGPPQKQRVESTIKSKINALIKPKMLKNNALFVVGECAATPLVLRGARQVGETWLVRDLAQHHGRALVELNFER